MTPNPQNLSHIESLLFNHLSTSATEHLKELNELQKLLAQVDDQAQRDSSLVLDEFEKLNRRLDILFARVHHVQVLEPQLKSLAGQMSALQRQSQAITEAHRQAVSAFNSMQVAPYALSRIGPRSEIECLELHIKRLESRIKDLEFTNSAAAADPEPCRRK
jgi:SMC interacting uncharacterized protein involved in chromosome segregation